MKQFFLIFAICFVFIFAGCQVLDNITGLLVQPKQPVNHGMTLDEYAAWYNEHAKDNPGLLDPVSPETTELGKTDPVPLPLPPITPEVLTSKDFEPTTLAKTGELAADAAPIPFAGKAATALITAAGIWQAFRHNSKKNGQIKSMVEAIHKEGSPALKKLVEKKVVREGVAKELHKVVKVVKAASAIKALPEPRPPANGA